MIILNLRQIIKYCVHWIKNNFFAKNTCKMVHSFIYIYYIGIYVYIYSTDILEHKNVLCKLHHLTIWMITEWNMYDWKTFLEKFLSH